MYDIDRTSLTSRSIIRLSIFRIHCSTNRLIRLQRIVVRLFQIGSCEWIINNGESWPSNMRIRSLIWIIVNVTITWLRIIIPMLSENNYSFADLSRSTNFFEPSNISNKSKSSWLCTCRYCYFHHFFFN